MSVNDTPYSLETGLERVFSFFRIPPIPLLLLASLVMNVMALVVPFVGVEVYMKEEKVFNVVSLFSKVNLGLAYALVFPFV